MQIARGPRAAGAVGYAVFGPEPKTVEGALAWALIGGIDGICGAVTKNAFLCGSLNGAVFRGAEDRLVNHRCSSWQDLAMAAFQNGLLSVGAGWAGYGLSKVTKPAWTWLKSAFGRGVSEAGPGAWGVVAESMSERAAAYQTQITGRAAGSVYWLNGVKFDGFADGVLQDAKGPRYMPRLSRTAPSSPGSGALTSSLIKRSDKFELPRAYRSCGLWLRSRRSVRYVACSMTRVSLESLPFTCLRGDRVQCKPPTSVPTGAIVVKLRLSVGNACRAVCLAWVRSTRFLRLGF